MYLPVEKSPPGAEENSANVIWRYESGKNKQKEEKDR